MKTLPDFFIVGAARSGTTSLDRYLSQHPEIYITPHKENHFFASDFFPSSFTGPGDERLNELLIRDEEQYTQLFAHVTGAKAIGEASAFYLGIPGAAERIAQAVPDAKILITLREPVARTYSAYMMLMRDGRETLDLEDGLRLETERKQRGFEPIWWYRELSLYHKQIRHYINVFGSRQVKVLFYEELFAHPTRVLSEVFAFLGVKEDVPINTSVRYNVSGVPKSRRLYTLLDNFIYNPGFLEKRVKVLVPKHLRVAWASKIIGMSVERVTMNPQQQAQLKASFAEDVGELKELLHRDLLWWQYKEHDMMQKS